MKLLFNCCILAVILLTGSCKKGETNDKQFSLLKSSIMSAVTDLEFENGQVYKKLHDNANDLTKRERTLRYYPLALELKEQTNKIMKYLDSVTNCLDKDESYITEQTNIDNLYYQLKEYRQGIVNTFSRSDFSIGKDYFSFFDSSKDGKNTFRKEYFEMKSSIACEATLASFQLIVKQKEKFLVNNFYHLTSYYGHSYDRFYPLVSQNTSLAKPGERIVINAGIGSFSIAAQPKVSFNNKFIEMNESGVAVFEVIARDTGNYAIPVRIEYTRPDGEKNIDSGTIRYKVRL